MADTPVVSHRYAFGDTGNHCILQHIRLHAMAQRGEGEEEDAVLFAELQQLPFRQFDLHHSRFDPRGGDYFVEGVEGDDREAGGFAATLIHQAFQGAPGVDQLDLAVVNHMPVHVAGILVVNVPSHRPRANPARAA